MGNMEIQKLFIIQGLNEDSLFFSTRNGLRIFGVFERANSQDSQS